MKSDFVLAITQLAAEKNLPKEVVLRAVESALLSAFKKENFAAGQDISVRISPQSGEVKVYTRKSVGENITDPRCEISVAEAQKVKNGARVGDIVEVESTPQNAGRIAAHIARQVILQRLREAEQDAIFAEYATKEGDIISGTVQRIEPKQITIDLERAQAILPVAEQIPTEHYHVGQRIKAYLMEVSHNNKSGLIVSRAHRNLLRRLFELEIAEIRNGTVELKAIAREAGHRSKVAVATRQEGIDPVACCIGKRGIRIQNIARELNGEKIDVVQWDPDPKKFVAKALSPAQVASVEINEAAKIATVIVPDRLLSLAIGKEGQNARLAAKLTGWRIDIKSASAAEAGKAAKEETISKEATLLVELKTEEKPTAKAALPTEKVLPSPAREEAEGEKKLVEAEPLTISETPLSLEEFLKETAARGEAQPIRFAEDLVPARNSQSDSRAKRDKKKGTSKERKEDTESSIKSKKEQRKQALFIEEAEDYEV